MSGGLKIGDRVRIVRGQHTGLEGVVEDVGSRVIGVRLSPDPGWPFTGLVGYGRADLVVISSDLNDVGEALL